MYPRVQPVRDEIEENTQHYLKQANKLNGFFKIQKWQDDHEDLHVMAIYIAIQLAEKIITREDLDKTIGFIHELEEAFIPIFKRQDEA